MSVKKNMVNLKINDIPVSVPEGTTVIEAAKAAGIVIPSLCYLKGLNEIGACRVCVVKIKGARGLVTSCVYPVAENMEVLTNTESVVKSRRTTLELILSDHDKSCLSCVRSTNCELQTLSREYGCDAARFNGVMNEYEKDKTTPYLVRDNGKCILCRRCVAACGRVQDVGVIGANGRGFHTRIGCAFERDLKDVPCIACGQCTVVCPTGALVEKDDTDLVAAAIEDPKKIVIVGTAPAVRVGLGEEFGTEIGANVEGKMVTALKRLGFDNVFDVNVTADLTIMEEGTEFINRLKNKGVLPMITSCSPGWIKYIESYFPEQLDHLSTCKSPQQMFGAIVKTYYAEKMGIDPKDIFTVTIMPCTAKKFERTRSHQDAAGVQDIDASLTVREFARMIKRAGLDFNKLAESPFDTPLGIASGAGLIFGATGGVMEAALRTVSAVLEGRPPAKIDFKEVRGTKGVKEATVKIAGKDVKVCVVSGIKNAKAVMEKVKSGKADWHFIEVMTCPGGCVNGGGQPVLPANVLNSTDIKAVRAKSIYQGDAKNKLRMSHESPVMKTLYKEYFGEPNSHKAHHILHTKYTKREKYPNNNEK
jgi:NADP-reducing hydrogenase subunit HndD